MKLAAQLFNSRRSERLEERPNNSKQLPALRAAADAER